MVGRRRIRLDGERLAYHRERRRMIQATLAKKSKLSKGTISRLENGRHEARFSTIEKLARALKIDPEELLVDDFLSGAQSSIVPPRLQSFLAAVLTMGIISLSAGAPLADAQTPYGNYVPVDPSTLPQVPGCTWFPDPNYPGLYQDWCGPDSNGNWYRPYDWYLLTGIWPPDYGLGGG